MRGTCYFVLVEAEHIKIISQNERNFFSLKAFP
jgi:hypothetical protein